MAVAVKYSRRDISSQIGCLAFSLSSASAFAMFSFFRRGKSKDDKSKEKSSFSPFKKSSDSSKKEASPVTTNVFDSSISLPTEDIEPPENTPGQILGPSDLDTTLQTHFTTPDDQQQQNGYHPKEDCIFPSDECPHLADQNQESSEEIFERAGSQNSDSGFKTAPNTPVLPKHLLVTEELVIDTPLGAQLNFPSADSDPEVESTKEGSPEELTKEKEEIKCGDKSYMCEEMSHGPGELYDIAEEETSEDEEEEEEDESEEEDDDDDSGNVTQPTIEEEYPEEVVK